MASARQNGGLTSLNRNLGVGGVFGMADWAQPSPCRICCSFSKARCKLVLASS
jgi:hypothetical protein